ncbi:M6 family metalloprotease domain-containing protein [Paraflavisolibacter sp. H34]|uniref:M6 family metalloprotease domain-containing protein n=1 Tax=Huijunlia imazamoxiresistens TaxID=3127457 RepID=UPI00301AB289
MKCKPYNLGGGLLAFILAFCVSSVRAQMLSNCPASPYPIQVQQANGTQLTIVGKGNMRKNWTETMDGYTVIHNNGNYEYAVKQGGRLLPSGIVAHNPGERKSTDALFLQQQPKSLKPDASTAPLTSVSAMSETPSRVPTTGNVRALMLLIRYPDLTSTNTVTDFNNLMNQSSFRGSGSFKDFYAASSFNQYNVTTDVVGWYTAAQSYNYYSEQSGSVRSIQLVREAVDAAQAAGVDFSLYDNDHNGTVDGLIVVHAGPGAEEGARLQYIWSHRWSLSVDGKAVTYDGVLINDYMINPERRIYTNAMTGRGVFCHEFGHGLGLPDLYDTDGGSEGLGEWSLMASASWLGNENTPGNMCAWSRAELGWLTPTVLTAGGTYSLQPASGSNQVYRINTPIASEYFLLENRQKTGLDVSINGSGLAIFHINTNKTTGSVRNSNGVNADENVKGIDLEEADNMNQLDNEINRGDAGDLFPGTSARTAFSDNTSPNARTYSGAASGIAISNIAISGGVASFTLNGPRTYYRDQDGDGYGNPGISTVASTQPTGYVANNTDCNDNNAAINPGAAELCDGVDNDCDGQIDEGVKKTYYRDQDGDGYGNGAVTTLACAAPSGYVANNADCNDNNAAIRPGATEICDGIDNDCDGQIDEGTASTTYYRDQDGDGYGNPNVTMQGCSIPTGYVTNNADCDDTNPAITNVGPTAVINGTSTVCANSTLSLSATEVTGATYAWTGPSGFTAATRQISIPNMTASRGGTYTLTVTRGACATSVTRSVTVNPLPPANAGTSQAIVAGQSVTIGAAAVAGRTYSWTSNPAGFTSALANPTVSPTVTTTYFLAETITATGCRQTGSVTITVSTKVTPSVTIAATATTVCSGTSVTFTATPVNGGAAPRYQWQRNGADISGATAATYSSSSLGDGNTLQCLLTSSAAGADPLTATSNEITMTVYSSAPPEPASIAGDKKVCPGDTRSYTVALTPRAMAYNWTVPSGVTLLSGQGTRTVQVQFGNTFSSGSLRVHATNCMGTSPVETAAISKTGAPAAPDQITGAARVCVGETITYSTPAVTTASSYTWTVPAGASIQTGQNTASITVLFSNTFTSGSVRVVANNCSGSSDDEGLSVSLQTKPSTPGSISGTSGPVCGQVTTYSVSSVSRATTYTWTVPANTVIQSGQGTRSIQLALLPGYTGGRLSVTASNCAGTSGASGKTLNDDNAEACAPGIVAAGVPEVMTAPLTVKLAPNPYSASSTLRLEGGDGQPVQLTVYNILGMRIEKRSNLAPNSPVRIGGNYLPGMYLVEVVQGNRRAVVRLVRQAE